MDKFFFSEKNVKRQSTTLEQLLNIKDHPDSKRKCKKLLVQQMTDVYGKYGKKKPPDMKTGDFIDLLNKKSIKECIRLCEENKTQKKSQQSQPQQINDYKRSRDEEVYGKRNVQVPKRPEYADINKGQQNNGANGMPGFTDGMGGFAPISQGNGEFITADGQMGAKMYFGDLEEQFSGKRGDAKDDLERKLYERASLYDQKGGMGMGNMGNNMQYDPLSGMMNGNMQMYNNDMMDPRSRMGNMGNMNDPNRSELNFTLVKGKNNTRPDTSYNNNVNNMDMNNMMNMNMNGMNENFTNQSNFDMNYMNNLGMNNMNMNNMGMNNMNNTGMNMNNMGMNMNNMGMNMNNMNMNNQNDNAMNNQNNGSMNNQNNMNNSQIGQGPPAANRMSDADVQFNYNNMMAERERQDNQKTQMTRNKNFNPLMSPHMNNMNNMNNMNDMFQCKWSIE